MTKLKPCPFCGGEGEVRATAGQDSQFPREWLARVRVQCADVDCRVGFHRLSTERSLAHAEKTRDAFVASLTDRWNRRKTPPKKTKEDSNDRKSRVRSTSR